MQPDIRRSLVI